MFESVLILKVVLFSLGSVIVDTNCVFLKLCHIMPDILYSSLQSNKENAWYIKRTQTCIYHEYNSANRGSYHSSLYIVNPGDTLFYIAWITGNDCLDLARINNIKNANILMVGQVLQVKYNVIVPTFCSKIFLKKVCIFVYKYFFSIKKSFFLIKKNFLSTEIIEKVDFNNIKKNNDTKFCYETISKSNENMLNGWNWPTHGRVINGFSDIEGGNKGIDISGALDQPIVATTGGIVVYAGNALSGYGNLIIIKHDGNYLSAYAHNNKILVVKYQQVKQGEKIATMGNSGTDKIKLHFEIRHKEKSVNPLHLLPVRY